MHHVFYFPFRRIINLLLKSVESKRAIFKNLEKIKLAERQVFENHGHLCEATLVISHVPCVNKLVLFQFFFGQVQCRKHLLVPIDLKCGFLIFNTHISSMSATVFRKRNDQTFFPRSLRSIAHALIPICLKMTSFEFKFKVTYFLSFLL